MHKTDDGGQLIMLDKLSGEKYWRFEKDVYIKTPYTFLVKSIIKFKMLWFYKDICIFKPTHLNILNETRIRFSVMRVECALHNLIRGDTG